MDIRHVSCPRCQVGFSCDTLLFTLGLSLHCPACDVYFETGQGEARGELGRGPALAGLARLEADTVYIPPGATRWPAESTP